MKVFQIHLLTLLLISCGTLMAQTQTAQVGSKVKQTKVCDPSNNPVSLPYFGQKALLIFYVDPDKANQNKTFIDNLERNQIKSDNIYGFGVVNLKDAPLMPNALVRAIIRRKVQKTGAAIYTDPSHMLRDAWGLGDINDQFVILIVSKEGTIDFLSKGELSAKQIADFYHAIDKNR